MSIAKINDIFEFNIMPYLRQTINEKVNYFYKNLSFLKDFKNNTLPDRNFLLEISGYLGISFDHEGSLNIYFYCFDEKLNSLLKVPLFTFEDFIKDKDLNLLLKAENQNDIEKTYKEIYKNNKDAVLELCLKSSKNINFDSDSFNDLVYEQALDILRKQLNRFLSS